MEQASEVKEGKETPLEVVDSISSKVANLNKATSEQISDTITEIAELMRQFYRLTQERVTEIVMAGKLSQLEVFEQVAKRVREAFESVENHLDKVSEQLTNLSGAGENKDKDLAEIRKQVAELHKSLESSLSWAAERLTESEDATASAKVQIEEAVEAVTNSPLTEAKSE